MKAFELKEMINKLKLYRKSAANLTTEVCYGVILANLRYVLMQDCKEIYDDTL